MTRRLRVKRQSNLRWSAEKFEMSCGSVKAHIAVFTQSIRARAKNLGRVSMVLFGKSDALFGFGRKQSYISRWRRLNGC